MYSLLHRNHTTKKRCLKKNWGIVFESRQRRAENKKKEFYKSGLVGLTTRWAVKGGGSLSMLWHWAQQRADHHTSTQVASPALAWGHPRHGTQRTKQGAKGPSGVIISPIIFSGSHQWWKLREVNRKSWTGCNMLGTGCRSSIFASFFQVQVAKSNHGGRTAERSEQNRVTKSTGFRIHWSWVRLHSLSM